MEKNMEEGKHAVHHNYYVSQKKNTVIFIVFLKHKFNCQKHDDDDDIVVVDKCGNIDSYLKPNYSHEQRSNNNRKQNSVQKK